ncbi:type VI secretion system contractile sheath domain-containing protein [Caulobacter segnis]
MAETLQQTVAPVADETVTADDFASLLQREFKPNTDAKQARIEEAVRTLAQQALEDTQIIGGDVFSTVDALKAAIDRKLTEQVNKIIHNAEFQKLESAWRGLWYLVGNTPTGKDLKVRVLNISKDETRKMLRQFRDAAWDQSPLFKKIYESEFGQLGGQPLRRVHLRLRVRPHGPGHRGDEGPVQDRRGRPRPVHRGGGSATSGHAELAGAGQSA